MLANETARSSSALSLRDPVIIGVVFKDPNVAGVPAAIWEFVPYSDHIQR